MKVFVTLTFLITTMATFAQKKILDHPDFEIWNTIEGESIAPDGNFVLFSLQQGEGDQTLKIKNTKATTVFQYERSEKGQFTHNSNYALFTIKPWRDSVLEMKRRKVKKEDLPKDSLGIYDLKQARLVKIANVKSYRIPQKWSGHVFYYLEEIKPEKKASGEPEADKKEKKKKVGKKNGHHLVVYNLKTQKKDTFKFVTDYALPKHGKRLAFSSSGADKKSKAGVYMLNLETNSLTEVHSAPKAKYFKLGFSESGKRLGFVADSDSTKVQIRPTELFYWEEGKERAEKLVDAASAPKGYRVSAHGEISFSKDESKLFFGLAGPKVLKDTTLVEDEIVNVEVWTYNEPRLYTVQELQLKNDSIKSYPSTIRLTQGRELVQLATTEYPNAELGDEGNAPYALVRNSKPYALERQWTGNLSHDYAIVNTVSGEITEILSKLSGTVKLSPKGNYVYGYNVVDSTWFTYGIKSRKYTALTKGKVFYNEINDVPNHPGSYGLAGWTEDDGALLLYDRYDIWKFSPEHTEGVRITKGRERKIRYRYLPLDKEERFLDSTKNWLLGLFDEDNKDSGYATYNPKTGGATTLVLEPYRYSPPKKALYSDKFIFSRQSFTSFPDIRVSDLRLKKQTVISNANPQQEGYNWGTIELVKWTSLDGKELTGMLIKPENFDPKKKYPLLVNFYEKSSNGLHTHRAPFPGRSTINYSFYASRGYLIFNPDVYYREGYPGESAYNCVIPGITSLIEKGFVDKDNIGVQGHSWGGYQIAYLVTKTDIFKAAESGAPVPNMISAYGGIRWWTGLSRQFQYEHTQSRIGGTPWEYPSRYIENSPIFNIDKINTPLLIMHNDADGHVPWYQGIEFFVSLRRLGKPSWFLNYNGEPHWPLKRQNRKDFNIRMAQYFDHYLKGAPKPLWMERGVPALEKGINQGYELLPATDDN